MKKIIAIVAASLSVIGLLTAAFFTYRQARSQSGLHLSNVTDGIKSCYQRTKNAVTGWFKPAVMSAII